MHHCFTKGTVMLFKRDFMVDFTWINNQNVRTLDSWSVYQAHCKRYSSHSKEFWENQPRNTYSKLYQVLIWEIAILLPFFSTCYFWKLLSYRGWVYLDHCLLFLIDQCLAILRIQTTYRARQRYIYPKQKLQRRYLIFKCI